MIRALLLALAVLSAPLQAAEVEQWLAKIGPALRGLDYEGTLVYLADGRIETMKVWHRDDDGHERERLIEVPARDGWRYGHRLWLERRTGLPLRVDLLDARGEAIEQVAFTELRFTTPDDADLRPSDDATPVRAQASAARLRRAPRWDVPVPPPGYALRASREAGSGVQLLYSDGLASVSVYVERVGPGLRGATTTRRGAVHARSYWVDGWRVLAIGKVPHAPVDRFARTLRALPGERTPPADG